MRSPPGTCERRWPPSAGTEVAAEKNSTLVLPFPVELLRFLERATPPEPTAVATPPEAAAPAHPARTNRPVLDSRQFNDARSATNGGTSRRRRRWTASRRSHAAAQPSSLPGYGGQAAL
ncbi:MAG: hypothetical protein DLM60_01325 [Pseudonocardiales bacterium]|nr:MAG: hypothetical protein DLM60_01325 [Pseudonocardiales bacterium]